MACRWCQGAMVEAPDPHGMIPTSTPNILRCFRTFPCWSQVCYKWCQGALVEVEAPDPHGTVPISASIICKVDENIHMLWMGRWIHHKPQPPYLFAQNSGSWLIHGSQRSKIYWLRPQIHMEGFPYPLQTHTRWLRTFICMWLADGSTIKPLPPFLLAEYLGFLPNSWVTNGLQMMSRCIGWGPGPTWKDSHIDFNYIQDGWEHSYAYGWADGSSIKPLLPFLLAQNLGSWPNSLSWVTAVLQMMSRCIGWGPRPTWKGSHIVFNCMHGGWEHSYAVDGQMDPPSCHPYPPHCHSWGAAMISDCCIPYPYVPCEYMGKIPPP